MKTDDSQWSSKFSLDTVGSWDRVHCEGNRGRSYEASSFLLEQGPWRCDYASYFATFFSFQIGVKIDLSASGLTKIITFMPYFMIVNMSPVSSTVVVGGR